MAVVPNKRSVMTLYSNPMDAYSHAVRFVLAEKSVTFEVVPVDPGNPPGDLLDLNPQPSLPTLVDRELVLSNAWVIMEYLDERFPHPPLLPVDPVSRARSRLLIHRIQSDWYGLLPDLLAGGEKRPSRARKELLEDLIAAAPILDVKPYFSFDELTLVDCWVVPLLWRLPQFKLNLPPQAAAVQAYAERLFARESFQASLSDAEREIREPA